MLSGRLRTPGSEHGFSLIETMVAMVTGLIVVGALFTVLEVSARQTSRDTDYVQSTQRGRIVMTHLVNELHSACLYLGFTPIQEKSGPNELIFVNAYSAEATPATAFEHIIKFEGGELVEKTWANKTGSSYPKFEFETSSTPTNITYLNGKSGDIAEVEGTHIFRYDKYAAEATGTSTTGESALTELTTSPLTAATAKEAAAVTISFRSLPTNKNTKLNRSLNLESLVTLALDAPRTEAKLSDKPCE